MKKKAICFLFVIVFPNFLFMAQQDETQIHFRNSTQSLTSNVIVENSFIGLIHPNLIHADENSWLTRITRESRLEELLSVQSQETGAPNPESKKKLVTGFFIKFGWMFAPEDYSCFENWWRAGLGFDIGLSRNFSLGLEFLPTYDHSEQDLSGDKISWDLISSFLFLNAKCGINLGGLADDLRNVNLIGGAGAGLKLSNLRQHVEHQFTWVEDTTGNTTESEFAFHFIFGPEVYLKALSIIFEYQPVCQICKNIIGETMLDWTHYFMFGLRF